MPKFLAVHPIPPTTIEEGNAMAKSAKTANTDLGSTYWVGSWLQLNEEGKITKILCEWNAVDIEAVRKELAKVPNLKANNDLPRDAFNVAVGIIWQLTLNIIPICLIIGQYRTMWISIIVLVVTSVIMKFTWYDTLGPGEMYMTDEE